MRAALLSLCLLRAALWCLFPVASKNKRKEVWEHIFIVLLWPCLWWFSSTYQTPALLFPRVKVWGGWWKPADGSILWIHWGLGLLHLEKLQSHGSRSQNLGGTDWDGRPQTNCSWGFYLSLFYSCSGVPEDEWFRGLEGRVRNSPASALPMEPRGRRYCLCGYKTRHVSNVCLWVFSRKKNCHTSCTVACGGAFSACPNKGWFEVEKCNTQMQLFASWRRIPANFPTFGGFRHLSSLMCSPWCWRSRTESRSKAAPPKSDILIVLSRKE